MTRSFTFIDEKIWIKGEGNYQYTIDLPNY